MYTLYVHIAPNNKKYFGITTLNTKSRWYSAGGGYKSQKLFWRAIQKYGWNSFQHIILADKLSKEWACKLEQDLIWKYKSNNPDYGYNVYSGGEIGALGIKFSDEFREKLRKANLGRHLSEETKQKISEANKGKKHTKEHNEKVRVANLGRKLTPEHCKKLSESHKGYKPSSEQCKKQGESLKKYIKNLSTVQQKKRIEAMVNSCKIPVCLYENDVLIEKFDSSKSCADFLNISPSLVCALIKGTRKYKNYTILKTFKK